MSLISWQAVKRSYLLIHEIGIYWTHISELTYDAANTQLNTHITSESATDQMYTPCCAHMIMIMIKVPVKAQPVYLRSWSVCHGHHSKHAVLSFPVQSYIKHLTI